MISDWKSQTLKINNKSIHLTRTGTEKPPIVLAHGFTDDGLCWTDIALKLEATYDLIMVDAIGHGDSDRITMGEPFDMVDDLYQVIKKLDLKKPTLIGHSMGAMVGAGVAARYPELLAALILEDVPWYEKVAPAKTEKKEKSEQPSFPEIVAKLQKGTLEQAIEKSKSYNLRWPDSMHEPWARSKMKFDLNFYKIKWPDFPEWEKVARAITTPTLLITGDTKLGALVTPALAIKAINIMKDASVGSVPGAGHCIRYEQLGTYMRILQNYLGSHFSPAKYATITASTK